MAMVTWREFQNWRKNSIFWFCGTKLKMNLQNQFNTKK